MRRVWLALTAGSCAGAALTGCTSGRAAPTATVRDSAGVSIVENSDPRSAGLQTWVLDSVPAVNIGSLEGDEGETLYQVADAVRLSQGQLVVANNGTAQLFYYDATGAFMHAAGGRGKGPGELQYVTSLVRLEGDSLLAMDALGRRADVFDPSGRFVRDFTPGGSKTFGSVLGRLPDGRWVGSGGSVLGGAGLEDGLQRLDQMFITYGPDGAIDDTIVTVPGSERFLHLIRSGARMRVSLRTPPFGRSTQAASFSGSLWIGTQDDPEVRQYAPDGRLLRIVRTGVTPIPVTDGHLEAFLDEQVASLDPADQASRRKEYEEMPVAETVPPYGVMKLDTDGNVWLQDRDDYLSPAGGWTVYDPEGQAIARVRLPEDLTVYEIGAAYVLGMQKDETDVEHVIVYRLARP